MVSSHADKFGINLTGRYPSFWLHPVPVEITVATYSIKKMTFTVEISTAKCPGTLSQLLYTNLLFVCAFKI